MTHYATATVWVDDIHRQSYCTPHLVWAPMNREPKFLPIKTITIFTMDPEHHLSRYDAIWIDYLHVSCTCLRSRFADHETKTIATRCHHGETLEIGFSHAISSGSLLCQPTCSSLVNNGANSLEAIKDRVVFIGSRAIYHILVTRSGSHR